jgi:hypothetical protein
MIAFPTTARKLLLMGLVAAAPAAAHGQVSWTDWTGTGTNALGIPQVHGTMSFLGTPVAVTFTGPYYFAQLACGTDYWSPNVYTGGTVTSPPGNCDIIALGQGGTKTIQFDQAVVDPLIAFVSWNGQGPIPFTGMNGAAVVVPELEVVAEGHGYWGNGDITTAGATMSPSGEAHGTVRIKGTYTSISFTDGDEYWHGVTIGAQALAPTATVPEPGTWALLATGLAGIAGIARRRRTR